MSYKKIVAGVATFAVASAMVVPAAFAAEATASGAPAPAPAPAKNAIAEAKAELQKAIDEAAKAAKELKGTNVLSVAIEKAKAVLATADEKGLGAAELKKAADELKAELKKVKEANKDNLEYKEKLQKDAVAYASKVLDQVAWFKDGTLKLTVADKEYTLAYLEGEAKALLALVKNAKAADLNTYQVEKQVELLKKAVAALESFVKKVDPSALTPKGLKAKEAAKKGGKKLPKTGEQTPVAPFAAAGAAALIAAGLIASRKVNA